MWFEGVLTFGCPGKPLKDKWNRNMVEVYGIDPRVTRLGLDCP